MERPIEKEKALISKAWKYHLGEWSQIDNPMVWYEGEDFDIAMKRAGYYSFPQQEYGGDLRLYVKKDDELPYLITFNLSDTIESVYVYDLPSVMQWLRDYSPIFLLSEMAFLQDETQTLLRRAFRAWHGHDYQNICARCDPLKYERIQQMRERKGERTAGAEY